MQVDVREGEDMSREVLDAMLAMAENAPEPGTLRPQDVLHKGDDELAAPMAVSSLGSAGYTRVYSLVPGPSYGQESLCNNNMLPAQLRKVWEDKSTGKRIRAFALHRPKDMASAIARVACVLHPSRREAWMDAAGLKLCTKSTLASEYEAEQHARHRHGSELAAVERYRNRVREGEERQERRLNAAATQALLEALLGRTQGLASSPPAAAQPEGTTPEVAAPLEDVSDTVVEPRGAVDRFAAARAARAVKRAGQLLPS